MLSIITVFHNNYPFNELFLDSLSKYTDVAYELIAVDNASDDPSPRLFEEHGARLLHSATNRNYSIAMNQGTRAAAGGYICHVNNDVVFSPGWASKLIEAIETEKLDFVCPSSIEIMPSFSMSKRALKKWCRIRRERVLQTKGDLLGSMDEMYGDWEAYIKKWIAGTPRSALKAINGHTVLMKRASWEQLGGYDERMLATDWDLFIRMNMAEHEGCRVKAPRVYFPVYVHHFMGATTMAAGGTTTYDARDPAFMNLEERWSKEILQEFWWNPMHLAPAPSLRRSPLRYAQYAAKRKLGLYYWGDPF